MGAACAWTWSAMRPVKVRFDWYCRVGPGGDVKSGEPSSRSLIITNTFTPLTTTSTTTTTDSITTFAQDYGSGDYRYPSGVFDRLKQRQHKQLLDMNLDHLTLLHHKLRDSCPPTVSNTPLTHSTPDPTCNRGHLHFGGESQQRDACVGRAHYSRQRCA